MAMQPTRTRPPVAVRGALAAMLQKPGVRNALRTNPTISAMMQQYMSVPQPPPMQAVPPTPPTPSMTAPMAPAAPSGATIRGRLPDLARGPDGRLIFPVAPPPQIALDARPSAASMLPAFAPTLPPMATAAMPQTMSMPSARPASQQPTRDNALLRGIATFLGFIPQGGTRGDTTEMIADFARGLLGENPIRQVEAEYNAGMAEEMLRRAMASGDMDQIAALSPEMALQLKRLGTFEEDRAIAAQERDMQRMVDQLALDQSRETNRINSASRVVAAAKAEAGTDPARFAMLINQAAQEQPNLFTNSELRIAAQPQGYDALSRYFAAIRTGTGSAPKPIEINHPTLGAVMLDPSTGQIMTDPATGQPLRPFEPMRVLNQAPGVNVTFNPADGTSYLTPMATGAGFAPQPAIAATPPSVGVAPQPGVAVQPAPAPAPAPQTPLRGATQDVVTEPLPQPVGQTLQQAVIEAEAAKARATTQATERAKMEVVQIDEFLKRQGEMSPFLSRMEQVLSISDDDLNLIMGMPGFGKALQGGLGSFTIPGSQAAAIAVPVEALMSELRLAGFQAIKGAGQVTEAESKFAAEGLANLMAGRYSGAKEFRQEVERIYNTMLAELQTRQARLAALRSGQSFEFATGTSEENILRLREMYPNVFQRKSTFVNPNAAASTGAPTTRLRVTIGPDGKAQMTKVE